MVHPSASATNRPLVWGAGPHQQRAQESDNKVFDGLLLRLPLPRPLQENNQESTNKGADREDRFPEVNTIFRKSDSKPIEEADYFVQAAKHLHPPVCY